MANRNWQPSWWENENHGSKWEQVKEALRRDWEQTKHDFRAGGRELDQDVNDTVKQAAGKDVIPPRSEANAPGGTPRQETKWDDIEEPYRYGYGAHSHYGAKDWDDNIETKLKSEWEETKDHSKQKWNDVKDYVRRGYDRAKS